MDPGRQPANGTLSTKLFQRDRITPRHRIFRQTMPGPTTLRLSTKPIVQQSPRARRAAGLPVTPPLYFGGLSEPEREVAAQAAGVCLMWPDTMPEIAAIIADMRARADRHGRTMRFGYRTHIVVRETEAEARSAATRLLSKLDATEGGRSATARSTRSRPGCRGRPSCATAPTTDT